MLNRLMMTFPRGSLKSSTHAYTEHDVWSRCTKIKQRTNHRAIKRWIEWDTICIFSKNKFAWHGCLAWTSVGHSKLIKKVFEIFGLGQENSFLKLLNLETEKHWCASVLNKRFFTPFRDGIWNHRQVSVCDRVSFPHDPEIVGDRPSWDPGWGRVRSGEASKPNHFRRYVHPTR